MSDTSDSLGDYSDSSDGTETYAQIVVPSYTLVGAVASSSNMSPSTQTPVTTGSSFLRLGSFPSLTSGNDPSGFTNSLALANLVGSATTLATTDAGDDPAPTALLDENVYKGDPYYLAGFTDDTRYRDSDETAYIDWVTVTNTTTVRKAETARLLTKGGWWDHSDGNRITTTCGDKVEVIQGNYKMVVLGRQPPSTTPESLATVELSGGHQVNQDAAPNANVMCVEYYKSDDGKWTVLEDNGGGNLTSRFEGELREHYLGPLRESHIGSGPGDYDGNLTKLPDTDKDPVIIEKTWAQRIETYIGSDGKPVPSITTVINAEAINEIRAGTEITSTTTAALHMESTFGAKVEMVVGAASEIVVGPKLEVHVGPKLQFHNFRNEIAAEKSRAILVDSKITAVQNNVSSLVQDIWEDHNKLAATVSELTAATQAIHGEVTHVSEAVTELKATHTTLGFNMTLLLDEFFAA